MLADKLVVAKIVGVKGLKGELRVKYFNEHLEDLTAITLLDSDNNSYKLIKAKRQKNVAIVRLEGVNTIEEAEKLVGLTLYMLKDDLPELQGDSYYIVELQGLRVLDSSGEEQGKVLSVHNFGANDILDITWQGKELMIPFTKEWVTKVDIKNNFIEVETSKLSEFLS